MLQQAEIDQLHNGTWELDCPIMTLQSGATDKPDIYEGAGYLRCTPEQDLVFKLYAKRKADIPPILRSNLAPGQLIPHSQYYTLSATDGKMRPWHAERILPHTSGFLEREGVVVWGRLYELKQSQTMASESARAPSLLTLRFFEDLELPFNVASERTKTVGGKLRMKSTSLNIAHFESCGCRFEISVEDGITTAQAYPVSGAIPRQLGIRLTEALQFVLAREVNWVVLETSEGDVHTTLIRQGSAAKKKGRLRRPLDDKTGQFGQHVWVLFDKYLTHVLGYEVPEKYHPLSALVRRLIVASAASIEAQALTLTVAVEGLLQCEFADLAALSEQELHELEQAQHVLGESDLDGELKERIRGALGGWKIPSATAKLRSLVESGVIDNAEYDAWKKLRHPSAHGQPPDLVDSQQFVDLSMATTVLFYKLIFHTIGYEGKYTDYRTLHWPLEDFPCTPRAATAD